MARRSALACALAMATWTMAAAGSDPATTVPGSGDIHPERWPEVPRAIALDRATERKIDRLLAKMTLEEKVGQIVQGDIASLTPEDVRQYRLGSILAGGNSDPGGKYNATPAEWLALADAMYAASMDTSGGGKAIPVLFGIDAVHGQSNIVGATIFPHNVGLGAARNPELIRDIGRVTALETRATGMEWTFAPTVAVPQDDRWGRSYEGYSEQPQLVAQYAAAMVEGLQGVPGKRGFLDGRHVVSSVKHYLGDGGTTEGVDQGDTKTSEEVLRDVHGAGYPPSIAAGAQAVMTSFSSYNGVKLAGHKPLVTDVLKDRMNFDGFVVTDWNAHGQVAGCTNERCPAAIDAGIDLLMAPDTWKPMYESTLAAARSGELPMARLDDAVRRVLRVKYRLGLFEAGTPSKRELGGRFELLAAPEHRALARQAVRESLVLLKNEDHLLPLKPGARVLVAGDGANDVGKQSGGWTLNWQGVGTTRADFPNAESIWEGLDKAVRDGGGQAELSVEGRYTQRPDVAVVVFGEDPYAEFLGDLPTLMYKPGDDTDLALIRRLKAEGIPVVAVFLSGRPLWMNREINAADAFVAAWLPGSEGGGIADVLIGDAQGRARHDFKGKLSFSWPRRADQYANNVGQPGYSPQFPFGYGLTYADAGDLAALPEEAGVSLSQARPGVYYARGAVTPGFALQLRDAKGTAEVAALPAYSPERRLEVRAVDHKAQEDARRYTWTGPAAVSILAAQPQDLTRQSNGDVQLAMTLRVDTAPQGEVRMRLACGEGCTAAVPLRETLAALAPGQWTTVGVPLKCFAVAGADLSKLDTVWSLEADAPAQLSVSRVALVSQGQAERTVWCRTMK